jgi:low affinity Fe/Cu permease
MSKEQGRVAALGCWLSGKVAEFAAHPYAQIAVVLICIGWFAAGWGENALTAGLSILAITLTQMVLNSQYAREAEATRRDVALHAKLDELIIATHEARNEIAGVEALEVEEIEALKEAAVVTPLPVARKARGRG